MVDLQRQVSSGCRPRTLSYLIYW